MDAKVVVQGGGSVVKRRAWSQELQMCASVGLEVQIFAAFRKMIRSRKRCAEDRAMRADVALSWNAKDVDAIGRVESSRDVGCDARWQCEIRRKGGKWG